MKKTVGTCSSCGGRVTVPVAWMSVKPPRPSCESCGAYAKQDHGPVVPMEPKHVQADIFRRTLRNAPR